MPSPGKVWSRDGHTGHSNVCKATGPSLLQEQCCCLSLLLTLKMVLLSPGCSLSVLFLPTEDGHLITPSSVRPSRAPHTWTSSPACPAPSHMGKGIVQPFGLTQRLWQLSPSPALQKEGLGQRWPRKEAFPWGSWWGPGWLSCSQGWFPRAVAMPSCARRVGDNG